MPIKLFIAFMLVSLFNNNVIAMPENIPTKSLSNNSSVNTKNIHRLDLNLFGTSCMMCYLKMDLELNKTKGIFKAAIMMVKPHSAVVIYDPNTITISKIIALINAHKLKISKIVDKKIDKIPTVLIPDDILRKS